MKPVLRLLIRLPWIALQVAVFEVKMLRRLPAVWRGMRALRARERLEAKKSSAFALRSEGRPTKVEL